MHLPLHVGPALQAEWLILPKKGLCVFSLWLGNCVWCVDTRIENKTKRQNIQQLGSGAYIRLIGEKRPSNRVHKLQEGSAATCLLQGKETSARGGKFDNLFADSTAARWIIPGRNLNPFYIGRERGGQKRTELGEGAGKLNEEIAGEDATLSVSSGQL